LILVDTSVWLQTDKREGQKEREEVLAIMNRDELATTGQVVAEVLQGALTERDYQEWVSRLAAPYFFSDTREAWEAAGRISFELRKQGMMTPLADLLIAAVALENYLLVYARDSHFDRVPGLKRYFPPEIS
jgi:predicted nucleic acid-binding protein